ncbi:MAG TPA: MBL fold metallo-hydrolase [Caulobacteraceae bacterium]|jgi:glyoxylase-like metal-dependent hydrolase (beta-lactamase superfamily II)|nr:MBL fold metallo-hydrolase [Caulobacteraceae bacterium]
MKTATSILAFAAASALAAAAYAQSAAPPPAPPAPQPLVIKQVKPGLYMITGSGGNSTARVTSAGVILIDTKNAGDAIYNDLIAKIRSVTDQPVKVVIDTHHHPDHTGNNGKFVAAGIPVIGQENLKVQLDKMVAPANNPNFRRPADPTVLYQTERVVEMGGVRAIAHHYQPAHTNGDTVVYFPDLKTVVMGDEYSTGTPSYDPEGGGDMTGWLASLDQVLKLDFDTAIPGHGDNPTSKAELQAFRAKVETFRDRARELVRQGVPKDQLLAKIKTDDLGWNVTQGIWARQDRIDGFYAELTKK